MADESILIPGVNKNENLNDISPEKYFLIENNLSEVPDNLKYKVRENIGAISEDYTYPKEDIDKLVSSSIINAINKYLNDDTTKERLEDIEHTIENIAKTNVDNKFLVPLSGKSPLKSDHFTTKQFVEDLITKHLASEDPHNILYEINKILSDYIKTSDTYNKKLLYSKDEINSALKSYAKLEESNHFTKPLYGVDPTSNSHLATKRYIDKVLNNHKTDIDPHGFLNILNNRLLSFARKKDVFDKTETYSRDQLDSIIYKTIDEIIDSVLNEYKSNIDLKVDSFRKQLNKVEDHISEVETALSEIPEYPELPEIIIPEPKECKWVTAGPVDATVGFVEADSELPKEMSFLDIMDSIFYGKYIYLDAPEYVIIGEKAELTICVRGSLVLMDQIEVYQDDELLDILKPDLFENGRCVTLETNAIKDYTNIKVVGIYENGNNLEVNKIIKATAPIFIGLIPKFKFGEDLNTAYLKELVKNDSLNNEWIAGIPNPIEKEYAYKSPELVKPIAIVPKIHNYKFESLITNSLSFGPEAILTGTITLNIDGIENGVQYVYYIYLQAVSSINLKLSFNFKN